MSDEWDGLLGPNEEILWQGAPIAHLRLDFNKGGNGVGGLVGLGIASIWMISASKSGGYFWMFGLIFAGTMLYNWIGVYFWRAYKRKHQFYTLTNERALIGTDIKGRKTLTGYPVTQDTVITFEEGKYTGDIYFAEDVVTSRKGHRTVTRIGFEQIDDARHVFGMMRKVQDADA